MIATLSWWLIIQLFGLAALPLAWRLCARLPGRGYPFAKALGLLLVSFILWLGATFRLLPNDVGGILVALALVVTLSAWLGQDGLRLPSGRKESAARSDRPLVAWLRANWRLILATELLFGLVLAAWALFRAYSGDITGTEKPMEFAFINGVLRSRFFPPQDPWLSGYAISYYYFGYVMVGVLIRLSGVDPAVGFNLAVALWYALTMIAAFGVVYDLVRPPVGDPPGPTGRRSPTGDGAGAGWPRPARPGLRLATGRGGTGERGNREAEEQKDKGARDASVPCRGSSTSVQQEGKGAEEQRDRPLSGVFDRAEGEGRRIRYGLLGALFVGFLGNLEGLVELAYHRSLVPLSWIRWLDIKQLTDNPPSGDWTGGFWWWWHASRVIHDKDLLGQSIEVIDEFPFFSFLLGDLHPHVLALPFVLLAIGLAVNLLLGARDWGLGIGDSGKIPNPQSLISNIWQSFGSATGLASAGVFLYAVVLGALAFLNTWDFPIYLALTTLAFGVGLALKDGLTWAVAGRTVAAGAVLGVLGVLFYLPFYLGFQSQAGGILPNLLFPTRFSQYFLMFGPFLVVAVFFLGLLSRGVTGERGSGKAGGQRGKGAGERRSQDVGFQDSHLVTDPARHMRGLSRTPHAVCGACHLVIRVLPWSLLLPLLFVGLVLLAGAALPQGRAFVQTLLDNPAVQANIGDRTLGQLAGLILRVRIATPWTYLLLASLIAWAVGLLWARLSDGDTGTRGQADTETRGRGDAGMADSHRVTLSDTYVVLMIILALLLTFFVEFAYLKDFFGTRMNTVFKFYYQAWIMLALAATYGLSRLAAKGVPAWLKWPAWLLATVLVLGGLFYPLAAIPSKADNFAGRPTLDGLAFLRNHNPADMAAIEWLRANVAPDAVVLEAPGGSYSPEGAERISMSTGNPTLLGWDFHERQWRGNAYDKLVAGRPEAIEKIYRSARPDELRELLDRWGIDYVYVGALERQKYGIGQAAQARFDRALKLVYDKDGVRIYTR